jgi:hypothetical protein
MTTSEIVYAMLEAKSIKATKDQYCNLESGIRASLDNHNGNGVERVGALPFKWQLKGV